MTSEKIYLLDSSAIIKSKIKTTIGRMVMTPEIAEELKDSWSRTILETFIEEGWLKILPAKRVFLKKVKEVESYLNVKIEYPDSTLIALALELKERGKKPIIFTEDYKLAKIAMYLGINCRLLIGGENKIRVRRAIVYCPVCGRTYRQGLLKCPICGVKLKIRY